MTMTMMMMMHKYLQVSKVKRHVVQLRETDRERDSCWLINNACFIHNQLDLSTQNTSCIMKSLAISLVQQHYGRPKNPANYRTAEPSHNTKDWGVHYRGAAGFKAFSEVSLTEEENILGFYIRIGWIKSNEFKVNSKYGTFCCSKQGCGFTSWPSVASVSPTVEGSSDIIPKYKLKCCRYLEHVRSPQL